MRSAEKSRNEQPFTLTSRSSGKTYETTISTPALSRSGSTVMPVMSWVTDLKFALPGADEVADLLHAGDWVDVVEAEYGVSVEVAFERVRVVGVQCVVERAGGRIESGGRLGHR